MVQNKTAVVRNFAEKFHSKKEWKVFEVNKQRYLVRSWTFDDLWSISGIVDRHLPTFMDEA